MWDLIVSVPDHCLSFYFVTKSYTPVLFDFIQIVECDVIFIIWGPIFKVYRSRLLKVIV